MDDEFELQIVQGDALMDRPFDVHAHSTVGVWNGNE